MEGREFGGQVAVTPDQYRSVCNYKVVRATKKKKKKCRLDGSPKTKERNVSLGSGMRVFKPSKFPDFSL